MTSSTRIDRMMRRRSEFATDLEFEIDASRVHWSELESTRTSVVPDAAGHGGATMGSDEAAHLTNSDCGESAEPVAGNWCFLQGPW